MYYNRYAFSAKSIQTYGTRSRISITDADNTYSAPVTRNWWPDSCLALKAKIGTAVYIEDSWNVFLHHINTPHLNIFALYYFSRCLTTQSYIAKSKRDQRAVTAA